VAARGAPGGGADAAASADGDGLRPVVAIVGAGFGGLRAARALAQAPVRVVLIDRHNHHLFQPLLYQVATAGLAPADIAQPVRSILAGQRNLDFHMAEVQAVDLGRRTLKLPAGDLAYDYLIVAAGGQTNDFGLAGVLRHGFGLKDLQDALRLRNHLLYQFELAAQTDDRRECAALLTFTVVGGGPTGVECAGAISELVRLVLVRDYPWLDQADVCIWLLEAADRLLPAFAPPLQRAAWQMLGRRHVHVRFNAAVDAFDGATVTLRGGETFPSRTLIWAAGIRAADLLNRLGAEQARLGRVVVTPTLQLPGRPEVFVIGDAAYLEQDGQPVPMVAPAAIQQGRLAGENLQRLLRREALKPFVYRDPGLLATIGRNDAVAQFGRRTFRGFLAWVLWLSVHLVQLIGFRNRLVVLINWAWDYFFYDRASRLITSR
jgi:NADH dehydrogenase